MFFKWMPTLGVKYCSLLCTLLLLLIVPVYSFALETVCAEVKIEIAQELTIERQAFEATLKIENTLADKTIESINVVVEFTNELGETVVATSDPNDTTAKFFIRINNLDGISDISGGGTLAGGQVANATWLIVPAPGASEGLPSGKLYFVGATFSYVLDGIDGAIEVAPDTIYVKPMPLLTLDYFLPFDVFADNPLTPDIIEPIEPFTLGVRIQNNGSGLGRNIKIESAQPEIVENEQELLIDFTLLDSYVQDEPINNSLLMTFGDIPAGESKVGSWRMQTTLSGRFTEFTAEYSHADELGGELTSLIEAANTHTLIRDVVVDAPGRDNIRDFLAYELSNKAGDIYVYESNSTTSPVANQSASATLSNDSVILTFPPASGFVYAQVADPYAGTKQIDSVIRNDGKQISANNAWFSKSYNKATKKISYHLNIFDVNSSGQYIFNYSDAERVPNSPVLQFIPLKITYEGNPIAFLIEASDADGTTPSIVANSLPEGANFYDQNDGSGVFSWTPNVGQQGSYEFQVVASDGELNAYQTVTVVVNSELDTDGDGLLDSWELEHFGDLSRDGSGDFDDDGILDRDEERNGTSPLIADVAINLAALESPFNESTLTADSTLFSWSDVDADRYELDIGTTEGGNDLFDSLKTIDTALTVDGLPVDGKIIYLRLWTVSGDVKGFKDYTFTAFHDGLISSVDFPDENFKQCIDEHAQERNWIYVHEVTNLDCELKQISDVTGVEKFTQLRGLNLLNNDISTIDLSTLNELRVLNLGYNQLTDVDVSGLINLVVLHLWSNSLTRLDVSTLTQLKVLHVDANQLNELDVSTLLDLRSLNVGNNNLSALQVSSLEELQFLWAYNNQLSQFDVSNLPALRRLNVSDNVLTAIDVSRLLDLTELKVANNTITAIATENLTNLQTLDVSNNVLPEIMLPNSDSIKLLEASHNRLSAIQVTHMSELEFLSVHNNQLLSLDLLGLDKLATVNAYRNQLSSLQVEGLQNLIKLHVDKNNLTSINLSGLTSLESLHVAHNSLVEIDVTESVNLNRLWAYNNFLTSLNVAGLENIVKLDASNNGLTSVNVSSSLALKELSLDDNNLETLDVSALINLEYLNVNYNQLETLRVDNLINLKNLHATYNQITAINVSNLVGLTEFTIWSNRLTELDASALILLTRLHVDNNALTSLNIDNLVNLTSLNIAGNSLSGLDISHLVNLQRYWE